MLELLPSMRTGFDRLSMLMDCAAPPGKVKAHAVCAGPQVHVLPRTYDPPLLCSLISSQVCLLP